MKGFDEARTALGAEERIAGARAPALGAEATTRRIDEGSIVLKDHQNSHLTNR